MHHCELYPGLLALSREGKLGNRDTEESLHLILNFVTALLQSCLKKNPQ